MRDDIKQEYDRWRAELPAEDAYETDVCLGIFDVLWAHFCIIDFFADYGEGIGGVGPRDLGLLQSTLHRQHTGLEGKAKWRDQFDIVATLFYGLIMNHPFHDANKRTAFLSCLFHLQKIGRSMTLTQTQFENFTVEIADHKLTNHKKFLELKQRSRDPEVLFISSYLKKHSRNISSQYRPINYMKLRTILHKFGYDLQNPKNNYIDVVRIEERRKIFDIFGKKERLDVRVAQIGFPGWKTEVSRPDMKRVRKECGLESEKGVDSLAFYGDEEPLRILIDKYQEPLRNLANR